MNDPLNHAPCGYFTFSPDGKIVEANHTLLHRLGFAKEELTGAKVELILTMASRIFYQTHFFPLLALHGKAEEIFMTFQSKDQQSVPMLAYASRQSDRIHCVVVPVEQRQKYEDEILAAKRAAEEASRSNRQLQEAQTQLAIQTQELELRIRQAERKNQDLLQVTHILFHDLREPIRKIETFSSIIAEESKLSQDSFTLLAKVDRACRRMTELLRALQQFVSVESPSDSCSSVNLNALIETAYERIRQAHPNCPASLSAEPLPVMEGYPRQLDLMFAHLFENAFQFRRPEEELTIRIEGNVVQHNQFRYIKERYRYVDFIQLVFSANGIGIAQEYSGTVFELLQKLDLQNPQPGCGLAICKKVAENHGGSIAVVPTEEPGTVLKLLLPLKQQ